MNGVEQNVPNKIEEYVVDLGWHHMVVRHVRRNVQDVEEPEKVWP